MTNYIVLLLGDEKAWEAATPEERAKTFDLHGRFSAALEARGHVVTGGAELASSGQARVLRIDAEGRSTATEGPYAETAEQLGGFYLVTSDDLDDLLEQCKILAEGEGGIEIRECLGGGTE